MTFDRKSFELDKNNNLIESKSDESFNEISRQFLEISNRHNYAYRWNWFGLPIIQMPEDILILQEIIFETRPNFIIQSGVSWGGSVALAASILSLISDGKVIGLDTRLPTNIQESFNKLPFCDSVILIEGSSTDTMIFKKVSEIIGDESRVLIVLDSLHTHDHVFKELNLWTPLLKPGDYAIVSSTRIETMPKHPHRERPWSVGNNPGTALAEFIELNPDFTLDNPYNSKVTLTYHPGGYLLRK